MSVSPRRAALSLLFDIERSGKYVNRALNTDRLGGFTPEERALIASLVFTVTERRLSLDYYINAFTGRSGSDIDPYVRGVLRLGMAQVLWLSVPDYAAVNESVALCRNPGERAIVNAVLRRTVREKNKLPTPDRKKSLCRAQSVEHSVPAWICRIFDERFGEEAAERILAAANEIPPLTLTVNIKKISRDGFLDYLKKNGVDCAPTPLSPIGVYAFCGGDVTAIPGFSEGFFHVQDEASQLCATVLGISDARVVADVCACPGGKSFTVAEGMDDGRVYSFDTVQSKLPLITSGASRLGLADRIEVALRDARDPDPSLVGKCDRVICDVPCSGLGVLSKKPDLRYRDKDGVAALPSLQLDILRAASRYVAPGGVIVYSTCTLRREENEDVVSEFLHTAPEFSPVDFAFGDGDGARRSEGGMMTLLPGLDGTDGFFICPMRRVAGM